MENGIDELLEKPCYVIDLLPQRVSKTADGQFSDIECYLLNSDWHNKIANKFEIIIFKLMCYYHVSILMNDWIDYPKPEVIDKAINEIMKSHYGTLNIVFPEENVLLVFEWDCLNLSIYNPPKSMIEIMEKLALTEGLFLWQSEN